MKQRSYDPERFKRKQLRLPAHDYSTTGAYFVTILATTRAPLFHQPELYRILHDTWKTLPTRFPEVTLDEFVIMPDHIHFILWLNKGSTSLGSVIGAYKSLTTVYWLRHLKSLGQDGERPGRIWHNNYYERVIRIDELEATRLYIRQNPHKLQNPPHPPDM
ncbi:MAG: transposase [Ktedonobacteraceae bacterium]|nr:transposase [Ktedonobacteraceae bacterium]MBO0797162.1 transposase [Ktedonobacteraceae bacterium]